MDGFEASMEMRKVESQSTRKRSQIIAITALSGEEHRERGLKE
jgi:CheY-like chemotaxis protein